MTFAAAVRILGEPCAVVASQATQDKAVCGLAV